jgi:anti-sigma B factor antagonist
VFNLHVSTRVRDGYVVVALRGEVDLANVGDVGAALIAATARAPLIIVDLATLTFIDASGIAALVRARKHAQKAGGDLYLCAPQAQARKVLSVIRPGDTFSVHTSVAEAARYRQFSG